MISPRCGVKLAVVGAGVVGLSTAYHLAERFSDAGVSVTVIAGRFSPNTTSDKAGALIQPLALSEKAEDDVHLQQWTRDTFKHFASLYHSETAAEVELSVVSGYRFMPRTSQLPWWKDLVFGFRCLPTESPEVRAVTQLPQPHDDMSVWAFSTYLLDCRRYLPWLMRGFIARGGVVEQRRLESLDELRDYDVVINCTGLGAAELVGDPDVRPVRGQAVLVRAPWINHFVIGDCESEVEMTYILPRPRDVLLGGTGVSGNWSETVDSATSEAIVARCVALLPSLRGAEVVGTWAGGRPGRKAVRLEREDRGPGRQPVIHNYGHGAQGIILHWGCALEVGRILEQLIESHDLHARL